MFKRAFIFFTRLRTYARERLPRLTPFTQPLAQPTGWTGASSRLEQAGFHARCQANFHAGFYASRSA